MNPIDIEEGMRVLLPTGQTGVVVGWCADRVDIRYDQLPPWQPGLSGDRGGDWGPARKVVLEPEHLKSMPALKLKQRSRITALRANGVRIDRATEDR